MISVDYEKNRNNDYISLLQGMNKLIEQLMCEFKFVWKIDKLSLKRLFSSVISLSWACVWTKLNESSLDIQYLVQLGSITILSTR